jgi:signal transduction histidine kinase
MVAEDKGVALESDVNGPLLVRADGGRLRQVCANLVDNAIKYTRSGGTVRLRARAEPGEVVLSIQDDGMGIPPGDLPRIWDRLYRADRSRTEHGLGLGLSFVRAIVEAHGGHVGVESVVNQGSTFTVRLPTEEAGDEQGG